jgi:hypothetical protein
MLAMLVWRMSGNREGQFSDNLEIITYKEQDNTVLLGRHIWSGCGT